MTLSAAERALFELVRSLVAGTDPLPAPGSLGASCEELVREHRLAPLAYARGSWQFRHDYAFGAVLAVRRERFLGEAARELSDAGIAVAFLKGMSYAGCLYDHPSERPMGDVDLLVVPEEHPRSVEVLEKLGYLSEPPDPFHHAVNLQRGRDFIDLHRAVVQPLRRRIDISRMLARAAPAAERTDGVLRLDPVDELLVHLISLLRTGLVAPLISYVDAAWLVRRLGPAGLETVRERARSWGFSRGVEIVLAMTQKLTGERVDGLRRVLCEDLVVSTAISAIVSFRRRRRWRDLARKFGMASSLRDAVGLGATVSCSALSRSGFLRPRSGAR